MRETDIQREVLLWLSLRFPGAFIRKVPLGPSMQRTGIRSKNPLSGFPDVMMILHGRYIGIECKVPGKKATEDQEKMHQWLRDAGGQVYVIDSLEDLRSQMQA